MRGLTVAERRWLGGKPGDHTLWDECCHALPDMLRDGRIYNSGLRNEVGGIRFPPTDLGRLALRVCPVDES
jgi:hypothetical protein